MLNTKDSTDCSRHPAAHRAVGDRHVGRLRGDCDREREVAEVGVVGLGGLVGFGELLAAAMRAAVAGQAELKLKPPWREGALDYRHPQDHGDDLQFAAAVGGCFMSNSKCALSTRAKLLLARSVIRPSAALGDRQLLAGRVSWRASLTADLGRPGPGIESQLPGAASYSHCRPLAIIRSARNSPRQRPVPKYIRHRPTTARRCSFSKSVARGLAVLVDIRCRQYVRSSIARTGTCRPKAGAGVSWEPAFVPLGARFGSRCS